MPDQYYFKDIFSAFLFGKYLGYPLFKVIAIDSSYFYWCANNIKEFKISNLAYHQIRDLFPNFIIPKTFAKNIGTNCGYYDCDCYCGYDPRNDWDDSEPATYNRYRGSWAQDEMGYSDDDIDTIFDGDPSAYWNID